MFSVTYKLDDSPELSAITFAVDPEDDDVRTVRSWRGEDACNQTKLKALEDEGYKPLPEGEKPKYHAAHRSSISERLGGMFINREISEDEMLGAYKALEVRDSWASVIEAKRFGAQSAAMEEQYLAENPSFAAKFWADRNQATGPAPSPC